MALFKASRRWTMMTTMTFTTKTKRMKTTSRTISLRRDVAVSPLARPLLAPRPVSAVGATEKESEQMGIYSVTVSGDSYDELVHNFTSMWREMIDAGEGDDEPAKPAKK